MNVKNIILTQDYFPLIGGAHHWLHEVYIRNPLPITVLTQDYSANSQLKMRQKQFDALDQKLLKIYREDIQIRNVNLLSPQCIRRYKKILKCLSEISQGAHSIIHCIKAFPEGISSIAFKLGHRNNCKVVTYVHGEELLVARTSRQLSILSKWVYDNSDLVIANSRFSDNFVRKFSPKCNSIVIHPGVNSKAFSITDEMKNACRKAWGWPDDAVILATIARMEPRKNHAAVIEAIHNLRRRGLNLSYVVVGEGEEQSSLQRLVQKLGVSEWVRFTGYLSNEERTLALASSDVYIMPSIHVGAMVEGFGIAFLEASAAGIPSIAGDVGGQPEAVLHEETGLIVNGSNQSDVEGAIARLTLDSDLRRRMGAKARIWAAKNDWDIIAQRTFEAINDIDS